MGVKVRASTQIFDDAHLLVTPADLERLAKAIVTEPASGEHKVYAIKRLPSGEYVFDFESDPEV